MRRRSGLYWPSDRLIRCISASNTPRMSRCASVRAGSNALIEPSDGRATVAPHVAAPTPLPHAADQAGTRARAPCLQSARAPCRAADRERAPPARHRVLDQTRRLDPSYARSDGTAPRSSPRSPRARRGEPRARHRGPPAARSPPAPRIPVRTDAHHAMARRSGRQSSRVRGLFRSRRPIGGDDDAVARPRQGAAREYARCVLELDRAGAVLPVRGSGSTDQPGAQAK